MFECFDCKRVAFLIQGSCDRCEPELHEQYKKMRRAYDEISLRYLYETGLEPLSDWYAFEKWVEVNRG